MGNLQQNTQFDIGLESDDLRYAKIEDASVLLLDMQWYILCF